MLASRESLNLHFLLTKSSRPATELTTLCCRPIAVSLAKSKSRESSLADSSKEELEDESVDAEEHEDTMLALPSELETDNWSGSGDPDAVCLENQEELQPTELPGASGPFPGSVPARGTLGIALGIS
jgi:hypothetical protein